MKPTLKSYEESFLNHVCDGIKDDVINKRLDYLLKWYSRKAQRNKHWYNGIRIVTYLIPCLISLLSVFASIFKIDGNITIAVIASLSAGLVLLHHIVDHYRFYESWIRYRTTVEILKREAELFLNRCNPYNDNDDLKNKKLFAEIIEYATDAELSSWEILRSESNKPFKNENQATVQSASGNPSTKSANTPNVAP